MDTNKLMHCSLEADLYFLDRGYSYLGKGFFIKEEMSGGERRIRKEKGIYTMEVVDQHGRALTGRNPIGC